VAIDMQTSDTQTMGMETSEPLLHLVNVDYRVGDKALVRSLNCAVMAGQVSVLLGPNGAGKSTLLKLASGELTPMAGSVHFQGSKLAERELSERAQCLAVLPQSSPLSFPFLSEEVVLLGRTPHSTGARRDADIVNQALRLADAEHLRRQAYTQLSGGEQQRVQLARIFAQVWEMQPARANLLILDEPTSALDFSHQRLILQALRDKADQGCGVLLALHDLNLAAAFADQVLLMNKGALRAQGSVDEVLQPPLLSEVFGLEFYRMHHPGTGKPLLVY